MATTTAAASISKTLARKLYSGGPIHLKLVPREPSLSFFSTSAAPAISSVPEEPPSTSASQPQEQKGGSTWSNLLLFIPGALTFGLGTWQIYRREEKMKMLDYRKDRLGLEPIRCNNTALSSEKLDSLEFRRVVCKGVFDDKKSVFVGPRSRSISGVTENGYYLITPLVPIPSIAESPTKMLPSAILVNRGWVPASWRNKALKVSQDDEQPASVPYPSAQKSGRSSWWRFWSKQPNVIEIEVPVVAPVEVVGVVRGSEKPSIFVPANDPSSFQWFYVDVPAIARACGLPQNTLYIEDVNENVNASNPYPVPKEINTLIRSSVMPQDHLNYTLTWYSLSAAVTFMAFKRLKPKKRHR
ncbi:unnamed protein product [Ilex paraguariensis]|uniref:SURF1-like protein n=1 Tax=Ilex paraguariensis TaxID=185542 RepID=A0ABC8UEB7_9AQUA